MYTPKKKGGNKPNLKDVNRNVNNTNVGALVLALCAPVYFTPSAARRLLARIPDTV